MRRERSLKMVILVARSCVDPAHFFHSPFSFVSDLLGDCNWLSEIGGLGTCFVILASLCS